MPPYIPRKRLRNASEPAEPKKVKRESPASRKSTLYDDLDAAVAPLTAPQPDALFADQSNDSESSSSLSELSDDEAFEDVTLPAAHRSQDGESDNDDDVKFEDVLPHQPAVPDAPITGDLELNLTQDTRVSLVDESGGRKGHSKRERIVRGSTHRLHVQSLLWHNAIRNCWICDAQVQATMVSHLTPRLWEEIDRWRRSSGLQPPSESHPARRRRARKSPTASPRARAKKTQEWGQDALMVEEGTVDWSHGDPLFRLMQALSSWWRQRFRITAPGLRKWGYMPLERLDRLTKSYFADGNDPIHFGERIASLDEFRDCACSCRGSRDVGAQLFTALLRGLGLEARMVANIQCLGFGWSKLEDAAPEHPRNPSTKPQDTTNLPTNTSTTSDGQHRARAATKTTSKRIEHSQPGGNFLSRPETELALEYEDTDDESVIDMQITSSKSHKTSSKIDADLAYPHYWTEVLSPITRKYLPVDAIVRNTVATNRELVEHFEPRGAKADKARQVIAYVVGYSQDGTAKDITVRYLKRKMLPGRTKGLRYPPEKVPIHNKRGKTRIDTFDWFKRTMSGYNRGSKKVPLTQVDEMEDSSDLLPSTTEGKQVREGQETLQYYKQSPDFILERHLRREESLRDGATSVKTFKSKGKNGATSEEDVFLRSDVVAVKSTETWHKLGRAPNAGERPLKKVPYRAATTKRRREILEAESATGEKVQQGLYSFDQTSWIIPAPIENGVILKNEYGNIDLFAEHMCPEGAVHVPFRGAIGVCKRLGIDYAEAVVDFEFGHRMAVPVIEGVVVAEENHDMVMQHLAEDEKERQRKADEKRQKAALAQWRRLLMGLRIMERLRPSDETTDGDNMSVTDPHERVQPGTKRLQQDCLPSNMDLAGGFLHPGSEEEPDAQCTRSAFFPDREEDEDNQSIDSTHIILEDKL